ncbi:hypothetical protein A2707_01675 [Candidatus Saccharibacteria bacterium RIFCSPHIGHO2_01_FULL_45_15]|nr:MAG: hypothetical protein A2707_01675 [Candidatus Saccharibacteria bacterium RIFCSPHIGHO2_01_FULL_45_15]OGL27987.1 MAG: hypothetical protein A3C39_02770 [Candidatus Saccharibacteria bacterium RIFCSPHIGHO2_02_FULL_46_12]OGL31706.1 MAG: hypothetical protein A3E76_01165 [Candidatus Saccharibacteria bacterium RIFCSPHIGHO2_12_FULL_44_22]
MNNETIIILAVLIVLLVEVTYLVKKLPRSQNGSKKRMILVDTSVLIDGRIKSVAKTGFIGDLLVIPRSVIGELQFLADNADHDKRSRARYGLDVVKDLQEMEQVEVTILQDGSKASEGVDERLLTLAKKHRAAICTIDYNLNKVAVVEDIVVLNINELAQNLRMSHLPGERIRIELVQKGQDSHQGVGYLPDGTMVVVEHAVKQIGEIVEIEFIRSLQTAAGKMMFAKRVGAEATKKPEKGIVQKLKTIKVLKKETAEPASVQPQVAVETAPAAVFHSESLRGSGKKQQRTPRPAGKKPLTQPRTSERRQSPQSETGETKRQDVSQSSKQSRQRSSKPKTSAQREAALIDLVDNQ